MPYKPYRGGAAGAKALSKSEVVSTTSAAASALGKKANPPETPGFAAKAAARPLTGKTLGISCQGISRYLRVPSNENSREHGRRGGDTAMTGRCP